jgi:hypothetical protein
MKKSTLAHSLGYAALTVVLTAGAAQSLSGSNTVFSDDIVNGQVYGGDIASSAITGSKVYDNSLTGADINESTLGLTCPAGMSKVDDVCYTDLKPPANRLAASTNCTNSRLRLPSIGEAQLLGVVDTSDVPAWTDNWFLNGSTPFGTATNGLTMWVYPYTTVLAFRCVTTVGARP